MQLAFDVESIRTTLQHGIDTGRWRLEDLDRPAPATHILMREVARHPDPNMRILSNKPHRNLLRGSAAGTSRGRTRASRLR